MYRDFSESAKQKLLKYVDETTETSFWGQFGDAIADSFTKARGWFGYLNITKYVNNLDEYHKKVIDRNNVTKERINGIFELADKIDKRYDKGFTGGVTTLANITKFIQDLADTIDPSGGNLDMAKQKEVLAADLEAIRKSQSTSEQIIEESSLGTDPETAKMSADPVNLSTGNFVYDLTDLKVEGEIPLEFHRYYNSKDIRVGTMGKCFLHNYEVSLEEEEDLISVRLEDGQVIHFKTEDKKVWLGTDHSMGNLSKKQSGYVFEKHSEENILFDSEGKMIRKENLNGRGITFSYDKKKRLIEAKTDTKKSLVYVYDEEGFLCEVSDDTGRTVRLNYKNNMLESVQNASGAVYTYKYSQSGRIDGIYNAQSVMAVKNEYDGKHRVIKQSFPDGSKMTFVYNDSENEVILTERNGISTTYVHDDKYRNVQTIYADGTSEKYMYNDRNQCISITDRNGHVKRMAYDNHGNLTQIIEPSKKRTNMTYDANGRLLNISINGKSRQKNLYDANGNLIKIETANGGYEYAEYDEYGRIICLGYANGRKEEISYDSCGNIIKIADNSGSETFYEYDNLNRIITMSDPNGNNTSYEYDVADRVTKITDALGNCRTHVYNTSGQMVGLVDFDGYRVSVTYNSIGKVETLTDKEGNVHRYTYDNMWNVKAQTTADGAETEFEYDWNNRLSRVVLPHKESVLFGYDGVGNRTSVIDENGNETKFVYDADNRLVKIIENDGAETSYIYDREGNLATTVDAMGYKTSYTYDLEGHKTSETNPKGEVTRYFYDLMGNLEKECFPNGSEKVYEYDLSGNLVSIIHPNGIKETRIYDKNSNLICEMSGENKVFDREYDPLNRVVLSVNALGGVMKRRYDAADHVTEIIDENGNQTRYEYSPNGNLVKVTDAYENETVYEYDAMNRLTKIIAKDIESGEIQTKSYNYDIAGCLTSVVDALGNEEKYEYDPAGRLREKLDRDHCLTKFRYNTAGELEEILYADGRKVSMTYNAMRQLKSMQDWNGLTTFELDEMGRPVSVVDSYGNTVGYEWGNMGEKLAITYPEGIQVRYDYDKALQLKQLHTPLGIVKYEHDDEGRVKEKLLSNGMKTQYQYNASGYITDILHESVNSKEHISYEYDLVGNKVFAKKERPNVKEDSGEFFYRYDALNRLISVSHNGEKIRKYEYNAFGNRRRKAEYKAGKEQITDYFYNAKNQLMLEADSSALKNYCYDKRGNLTKVEMSGNVLQKFVFDSANRMSSSRKMGVEENYLYNGLGHRIAKNQNSYVLDMTRDYNNMLSCCEVSGEQKMFFWDEHVVGMQSESTGYYFTQDDLGSPMNLLDFAGENVESYAFDEFGRDMTGEKYSIQPFGFTGYQLDENSGLYYAQARRYDANAGRFVSEDKIKGLVEYPQTLNHYNYALCNPLIYMDLDGKFIITAAITGMVVGGLLGVGGTYVKSKITGEKATVKDYVSSGAAGMLGGVFAGFTGGWSIIAAGAVSSGGETLIKGVWDRNDGTVKGNWGQLWGDTAKDAVVGGITGAIFGKIGEKLTKTTAGGWSKVAKMAGTKVGKGTWGLGSLSAKTWGKIFATTAIGEVPGFITGMFTSAVDKQKCIALG